MASKATPTIGNPAELRALIAANAPGKNQLAALPEKLSPSRAASYKKCPQAFYYETLCKIRTPGSFATLRGTLTHACCERIFDHPPEDRTPELALTYLRPAWEALVNPDLSGMDEKEAARALADAEEAKAIVAPGTDAENDLLEAAEACVRSWFLMERVANFTPPRDVTLENGQTIEDGRELYVLANLSGLTVHGFIDRLDMYQTEDGRTIWSISDYKTSACAPWEKNPNYGAELRERIRRDAFFQLRVYAVAAYYMFGIRVGMLRLVYVATGDRDKGIGTEYVDQAMIDETIAELKELWSGIKRSARSGVWATKKQPLCNWCYFHDICPAWNSDIADIVAEEEHLKVG